MKLAVFLDGRPGHEKQSRGIVTALARLCPVQLQTIALPNRSLTQTIIEIAGLLLRPDGGCQHVLTGTDLLLGTGTRTHLPLLAAKRKYGLPVVTAMAPDWYWRRFFDLCCVPWHDGLAAAPNILATIGPPNLCTNSGRHDPGQGMILVGGADPKSHYWQSHEIARNIEKVVTRQPHCRWYIATSPRTPSDMDSVLQALVQNFPQCHYFPFREAPPGWLETQYQQASQVWVTADSMSMVYEALSAGCAVGLLPVRWRRSVNKFQRSAEYLREKGYIVWFQDWCQGKELSTPAVILNEAQRCAEEIVRRWCRDR